MYISAGLDGPLAFIEVSGVGCGAGVGRGVGCWEGAVVAWTVVSGRKMASRKLDTVD